MAKLIVLGFVGAFVIAAYFFSGSESLTPVRYAALQTYDVYLPKKCATLDIIAWGKGQSTFSSDIQDFLAMKRKIEACGGHVVATK